MREDSQVPDLTGHHISVRLRTYSRSPVFLWGVRSCLGGHAVSVGSVSDCPVVAVVDAATALDELDTALERDAVNGLIDGEPMPSVIVGIPTVGSALPTALTRGFYCLLSQAYTITELRDCVAAATLGNSYIQGRFDSASSPTKTDPWSHLTDREIQVLKAITRGDSDDRIARLLGISRRTVRFHVANIFTKLNVRSRCAAAVLAVTVSPRS